MTFIVTNLTVEVAVILVSVVIGSVVAVDVFVIVLASVVVAILDIFAVFVENIGEVDVVGIA